MKKITLEEVRYNYDNGDYKTKLEYVKESRLKDNYIFDEEKSVKWNKEQVIKHNEQLKIDKTAYRNDQQRLSNKLTDDVIAALMHEYNINENVARKVEGYVYTEYRSCMSDYFSAFSDIMDFVIEIINCK
jgi:hypothetical protein